MTSRAPATQLEELQARCRDLEQQLRDADSERRRILGRLLSAQRQERRRIAAELHDDTVQVLTAAMMALDRIVHGPDADPEQMRATARKARATLCAATDRTRRLMFELRPPKGLNRAVRELAREVRAETGLLVDLAVDEEALPALVEEVAYRTVREAVTNVRKHAHARTLDIRLAVRVGVLEGAVSDDGRGFDVAEARHRHGGGLHLGLETLVERVELAGGRAAVCSRPGAGTRVEFAIPLEASRIPAA